MERNGREMLGTGDRGGGRLPLRPAPSPCHMALLQGLGNDARQGTLVRLRRAETDREDGLERVLGGGEGGLTENGTGSLWREENILELDYSSGSQPCEYTKNIELYILNG